MGSYSDTVIDLVVNGPYPITVERAEHLLRSLAEECDRYETKWREVLKAEQAMSDAYVRLRGMIPRALHTPPTPVNPDGHYPLNFVFDWTVDCMREYVHVSEAAVSYPADMARETLEW